MVNDIFQRISIPKPCHEDWSKMTPDEKGAFCKLCNKSVYDFSTQSAEEVERVLLAEEPGKVCGRFSVKQLPLVQDIQVSLHLLPRNISPFKAFALAVFLVFGTALFGLTNLEGQSMKGKVCYHPSKPHSIPMAGRKNMSKGEVSYVSKEPETKVTEMTVLGGVCAAPPSVSARRMDTTADGRMDKMLVGDVSYYKLEPKQNHDSTIPCFAQPNVKPTGTISVSKVEGVSEHAIEGQFPMIEPISLPSTGRIDPDPDQETHPGSEATSPNLLQGFIMGDTTIPCPPQHSMQSKSAVDNRISDGSMSNVHTVSPRPDSLASFQQSAPLPEWPLDTPQANTLKLADAEIQNPDAIDLPPVVSCFPNPCTGVTTLSYELKQESDVQAAVLDSRGDLVMQVFQIKDHYTGIYNRQIDLSSLPNGVYLIRVIMNKALVTTRIVMQR